MKGAGAVPITCPGCGARANVAVETVGRTLRCPRCARVFKAERPPEPAATVPEESPAPQTAPETHEPRRAPAEWRPGEVLFGLYEVVGLLGQGGMGRVYRVRHPGWRMDLAAKVPLAEMLASAGRADAIEREAETWVNLGQHPHIVSCFYVRRLEGVPLVFAEFVDGGSLRDSIADGRLTTLEKILDVAIQVAWGLHFAHEQGLVHLDVKPANVMLTSEGVAKVTDFGLARARGSGSGLASLPADATGGTTLTVENAQGGTPAYASPEQFTEAALTRRSDVWSWALCVLELFQGQRTWEHGRAASAILEEYLKVGLAPGMPAMPESVADLLQACFRDAPEDRPRTLREAADVLRFAYEAATGVPYPRGEPRAAGGEADNLNNRAVSLLDLGRSAEAGQLWQRALDTQPHHVEATYNGALAPWIRGELADDEALRRLRESAATNWSNPRSHRLLGRFLFALGDVPAAARAFDEAQRWGEREADFEREHGLCLLVPASTWDAGVARAVEGFERALRQGSRDAVDVIGFALALERSGELERARAFYAQAAANRADLPRDLASAAAAHLARHEGGTRLKGLQDSAQALVATPDGKLVIAGSGNQLRIWDAHTGAHVRTVTAQDPRLHALAVTPDSRRLIRAGEHGEHVWDLATGLPMRPWPRHTGHSSALVVTPDGRHAICGGSDRLIRICDPGTGECVKTLEGHQAAVTCVAVGAQRVVTGSRDGTVRVWDLESGQALSVLSGHTGRVNAVLLSEELGRVVSAGDDRTVRVWDLASQGPPATFAGHTQTVTTLAMGPRGLVLSGSIDSTVRAWDVAAGRLHSVLRMDAAVGALVSVSEEAVWAAQGTFVTALSFPERPRLPAFALARPVTAGEVEERGTAFAESLSAARRSLEEGQHALALEFVRTARNVPGHERSAEAVELWDQISAQLPRKGVQSAWEELRLDGHADRVLAVAIAGSGERALSGGLDGSLRFWNLGVTEPARVLPDHPPAVSAVAFLDARSAVSAGRDRCLRLWDVATGKAIGAFEGHEDYVTGVAASPDGSRLVSSSLDQAIRLWKVASGVSRVFKGHRSGVAGVTFSPDGRFLVSAGWDGVVGAWDVESGDCVCRLEGHDGSVTAVAVGPTGRQVASGGQDAKVRLWDLRERRCLRVLSGHMAEVTGLAFSPDGRHLASASRDGTVRIWTEQTGICERTLPHAGPVLCLAFTPLGSRLLTGCADHAVRIWHVDWEPEVRTAAWDDKAKPFVETFVSLRLKPETVRERVAELLNDREVDVLLSDLRRRGFGGLRREALLGQLRGLAVAPHVSYWDEVRSAAPPSRIPLPTPRRWPRKLVTGAVIAAVVVAVAFFAWVRPKPKLRVLRFMAKDVMAQYDLIELDAFQQPCEADYRSYLERAWQPEVSAPTLACLAGFRNSGTVGDYLSGAALRDPADGLHGRRLFRNALSLMVGLGEGASGSLVERLSDPDPDVRRLASLALALARRPEATDRLRRALSDSNPLVREAATMVVPHLLANEQLTAAEGWALLRERARDGEPSVRRAALRAHALFTPELASRAVSESVNDPDADVAATAREMLQAIETIRKRRFIEGES
jgi:WD40 repeat protein/serine/threonine protein kinase